MRNTLSDLQNHLFAELERLGDEDLKGEELREEINRAKAISAIATQAIANGNLVLKTKTFAYEHLSQNGDEIEKKIPPVLKSTFLRE